MDFKLSYLDEKLELQFRCVENLRMDDGNSVENVVAVVNDAVINKLGKRAP